ncbi:Glycosyltransferase type 1 [Halomicronema hongdechloris C2206]|uniref:Glycosyltransferase type 1 n=1 Tax=Halomicronema hongdechloris C2206 TaxID=1641165 RepID=A0A1Z3HNK8_9CYAN|nr:glycosyltransferase family 4 protein [Halomicronema hongdechloris]ASC71872.1 Glycosyltransferase type 1 [Halomicronema hongdechloris C2206]
MQPVLVLSWEFPPRIIGGIARHVAELYPELVALGHEIHLITVEFGQAPHYEIVEGIHIHRVAVPPASDFLGWIAHLNDSMGAYGGKLMREVGPFALIHAHDWLVGDAAIALKHHFQVPLLATFHATESGRHHGLHQPIHHYIHHKEWDLTYHAWRIIVCSHYMRHEVIQAFDCPEDKLDVIYNGIRLPGRASVSDIDLAAWRRRFAADDEQIVYYVGRLTFEKGVAVLLNAAPKVLWEMGGGVKFIIIGSGNADDLKRQAWDLGIWQQCYFTGFMAEQDLKHCQDLADCAVFPSLYEPFGIVALESFAARVPVVVSDAGGLPEVVRHGYSGIVTWANNADSLAWGILQVLQHPELARRLVNTAYAELQQRFAWPRLAGQTDAVYRRILSAVG